MNIVEVFNRSVSRAVSGFADTVGRLVDATIRIIKSDGFSSGVKRARAFVSRIVNKSLYPIKWIADSGSVKKVVRSVLNLFTRRLPKKGQQTIAVVSIVVFAIVLVLLVPDPDQPETQPREESKQPVISTTKSALPNFSEIPAGRERKAAFFEYFLALIEDHNRTIQKNRTKLVNWAQNKDAISAADAKEIDALATRYRLDDFDIESEKSWTLLLNRVDVVPPSLALAQSANESAWGTSRFARKAHNFFGQWCFRRGCGLVPKQRDDGKTHEVAAFDSPRESVKMYIRNLNSHGAYKPLREIRAKLRRSGKQVTGHALAPGLMRYSERGEEYVKELREMIEFNKLTQYD